MDRIGFRSYLDDEHDDLPPEVQDAWNTTRSEIDKLLDAWDEIGVTMDVAKQGYDTLMGQWRLVKTAVVAMRRELPPRFSRKFFSLDSELSSLKKKMDAMHSAYHDDEQ